jgi:hypothetical protein
VFNHGGYHAQQGGSCVRSNIKDPEVFSAGSDADESLRDNNAAALHARPCCCSHNFMRLPRPGLFGAPCRIFHARQLAALDGLTFVRQAACEDFERDWPEVETPRWVAPNGVDCVEWRPRAVRESLALVVGRATPEKGLLEPVRGACLEARAGAAALITRAAAG